MPPTTEQAEPAGQLETATSGVKRAQAEVASAQEQQQQDPKALRRDKPPSFKVVGRLVLAMKRFSNSINPTYTYGKKTASTNSGGQRRASSQEAEVNRPPSRHDVQHEQYAYPDHGNRFNFLVKPLPPTEDEEALK